MKRATLLGLTVQGWRIVEGVTLSQAPCPAAGAQWSAALCSEIVQSSMATIMSSRSVQQAVLHQV